MLVPEVLRPDLVVLRSPRLSALGVPHAFTTRLAGGLEDDAALVRAAGVPCQRLLRVRQVHGAHAHRPAPAGEEPRELVEADALVTDRPGDAVAIVTADCVPVLLASRDGGEVAAVHAGWRGLLQGVLAAAVGELGGRPAAAGLVAAIGPCLSPARFEVGPDVGAAFASAGHDDHVAPGAGDRRHVDLRAVAADQLRQLGVAALDVSDACTWDFTWDSTSEPTRQSTPEREELLHSYRRDVTHGSCERTGRQLACITANPGAGPRRRR
jgi:YfiH family protein